MLKCIFCGKNAERFLANTWLRIEVNSPRIFDAELSKFNFQ